MTPESIYSKSIPLSISELRPLLQRLLDCGFKASTSHTLHLTEYTLDPAYQLDINLYPAEEIRRWLDRIDTELNSTYYEVNFLRYSSDPLTQERQELDHKRSLLFWTRDYLALSPLATLTAYTEPAGLRLDLVDYYSVYECRLCGKYSYTPLLRPAFLELAAYVSKVARARVDFLCSDQLASSTSSVNATKLDKPLPPSKDAPFTDWFDWYHVCRDELGYRMTLKELGKEMGVSYSHLRNQHSLYMEEHS